MACFLEATTLEGAWPALKTMYIIAILFPALLFTFASIFPQEDRTPWFVKALVWSASSITALLIAVVPGFVLGHIQLAAHGNSVVFDKTSYVVYCAIFILIFLSGIAIAFSKFLSYSGKVRMQAGVYAMGLLANSIPGAYADLYLPYHGHYGHIWVGPVMSVFFVGCVTYSIVRHGLFDIKFAAVRTMAYLLSLASLGTIYYFCAYIVSSLFFKDSITSGVSMSPVNIIIALGLAFIFQPIKQFFDRITDRIFFRDKYDPEEFYGRLGEVLATSIDLRDLLHNVSSEIADTLKAEQTFFHVQYNHVGNVEVGTPHYTHLTKGDLEVLNQAYTQVQKRTIVSELLPREQAKVKTLLDRSKIAIILQLAHKHEILGYLALGEQRTGGYTNRDIKVLETIADELVIAIQNALSVQEVRDLNVNLQARINEATKELMLSNKKLTKLDETKDEFISMASHQLRTPLTSVKGYISMVLDGDAGDISKQQRELLEQAFESSQRMVYLIGDFLNISRLRTGKFVLEPSKVDLARVVQEEVAQLRDSATTRGITIRYDKPTHVPPLTADENKLRQVMMNFLDNAMYYTLAGGTVNVELYKTHTGIVFKVVDSGIGVPKAEQAKLFTKFFRAPNARKQRPDGTGIGLYMAKKVVVAHGGSILFESKEGKGSTFGFKLPLVIDPRRFDKPDEPDESTTK